MRPTLAIWWILAFQPPSQACVGHIQHNLDGIWPWQWQQSRNITIGDVGRLAITNVRVFDGYTISSPRTVIINGERIGEPGCDFESTYDAGGRVLIPGLIDSHVHPESVDALRDLTSYGVTTAMNMACHNYTTCQQLKHLPGLASFVTAGYNAIGPKSSHASFDKPSADKLFYNASETEWVHNVFGNGSDFLKITAETNGPSLESQYKLIAESHALGKAVATHASAVWTYQQAIDTASDHIQHVPLDGDLTADMVAAIVTQKLTTTPTIYVARAAAKNPLIIMLLGMSKLPNWKKAAAILAQAKRNLRILYEGGATILAGTDAVGRILPIINVPFGLSLHQELFDFVEAGMSPAEALRAATSVPAYAHRLHDRGHIMPGMRADMILLNTNPLDDITNTLDLEKVWVGGREYLDVKKRSK